MLFNTRTFRFLAPIACAALPLMAEAHWELDEKQSSLSFVSVKNSVIAETHQFGQFDLSVDDEGQVSGKIDLASVDTAIPIRDQRMKEILFETGTYPTAELSAKLDLKVLASLKSGETMPLSLPITLQLHGKSQTLNAQLVIAKLSKNTISVATRSPIMVDAGQFDLVTGLSKLQEIAGLQQIGTVVPVTGYWVLQTH